FGDRCYDLETGSAKATLRPPREEPHSLATSSLAIRLHRLRRVCLILTRTSFAAERIQIEFARTTGLESLVGWRLRRRSLGARDATHPVTRAVRNRRGPAPGF